MVRVGGGQELRAPVDLEFFEFDRRQLKPLWTVTLLRLKTIGSLIFAGLDVTSWTVTHLRLDFYLEHHQTRTIVDGRASATENDWPFGLYRIASRASTQLRFQHFRNHFECDCQQPEPLWTVTLLL
jgi:hypothetical protein